MDIFTRENRALVSKEDLRFFEETEIEVWLDGECIYDDNIDGFLIENQYDEDLVERMKKLREEDGIEFYEISGYWEIKKKKKD